MAKIQRNSPCPCGSGKKYKKCCGTAISQPLADESRSLETPVLAYSDETGNSGNNLFDSGQPEFWTGTLICGTDLDRAGAAIHAECLNLTGRPELHGNTLGLSGIEKIASRLQDFFARNGCHFLFTRLEKNHLASTKFFDVLMDSGINNAVSNLHYAMRTLRLSLAVQFIQLLDDQDRREFWDIYRTGDADGFKAILARLCERLSEIHEAGIYHDRTVQLLRDGMEWGLKYPEPLIEQKLGDLDSPNVVAFSLLVSLLHDLHQNTGIRVGTFVHDEQSQFGRSLGETFNLLKRFHFERTITASMLDIKELPTFGCELQMRTSANCIGLQLVDIVLWLTKRFIDTDGKVHGDCRNLAMQIIGSSSISNFTLQEMQEGVAKLLHTINERPFTDAHAARGRELVTD